MNQNSFGQNFGSSTGFGVTAVNGGSAQQSNPMQKLTNFEKYGLHNQHTLQRGDSLK